MTTDLYMPPSFLSTRRGKWTLAVVCAVATLDLLDATVVNIALPSMQRALGFSVADLQWVPNAYLLTYGGFMLLGGRAADLIGRRRVLVAGVLLMGGASLAGGLAMNSGVLVTARLAQGLGAAMTMPAALSVLTTRFREGRDRHTALGVWGRRRRHGLRRRSPHRRPAHAGARVAMGVLRQSHCVCSLPPADLPADPRGARLR
ncbi:MAG: MFS transporter [Solirubrobacteraceae bacterium]